MEARNRMLRQSARGIGFVALVFSLTVAALLTADATRSGSAETVRAETLQRTLAASRTTPTDPDAVAFARELDRLARRAYFNSLTFRQTGMLLLAVGLILTAAGFGVAWRLTLLIPDPRTLGESDPARTDRMAVNAVLATGGVLLLCAVVLHVTQRRRTAAQSADRDLRARLQNPAAPPDATRVCPCRQGTDPAALTEHWPFLRGPEMSGRSPLPRFPVRWNGVTGESVVWKTELRHGGSSTPVVWSNLLFLTSGNAEARSVMAHDTKTGSLLWHTEIPDGDKTGAALPDVMDETGLAASTPACDERHVYAVFGTGDLVALDHTGKPVWQIFLGRPKNTYGHASSLVYCGRMLIVQWDQEEHGRILALDKSTGRTLWETPRSAGMSWSTPVIMPVCDAFLLLVHATQQTWGMDLATGAKRWQVEAVGGEVAPSLTWEGDVWLAANCYSKMVAFRLPPQGPPEKLWEWEDGNLPDVASQVILDGLVYLANDAGEVFCHDLTNGKQVWLKEFEDGFYASPVAAGGHVYVVDRVKGVFRVFAAGREGRNVSTNPMGEAVSATPAFARGHIFVRGRKHLWAIGM